METTQVLISSPIGVLAVLCIVAAFFFLVAQVSEAKLFNYIPPLLFIYATPVFLSNLTVGGFNVIPNKSIIYTGLSQYALPVFIVLMLIKVNVPAVVKVMGKGVLVMLMGTAGVMVGGVVSYVIVSGWLPEDSWKGFGALAGSWIGGTANMLATKEMLEASDAQLGLAVVADNVRHRRRGEHWIDDVARTGERNARTDRRVDAGIYRCTVARRHEIDDLSRCQRPRPGGAGVARAQRGARTGR